jgi:integrase
MLSASKSASVIKNRRSAVIILAKHATAAGLSEPAGITKPWLRKYLLDQYRDRRGMGKDTFYQDLRSFWDWWAKDEGEPSPMAGIPRPGGSSPLVPVLTPEQIEKVLDAAKSAASPKEAARNYAIVWLMIESGLRRFELSALDLADIDLKAGTAMIRKGKGGKARTVTFGPSTAKALWKWLKVRGREDGPLFTNVKGRTVMASGRLTENGLSQLLARIRDASGVQVRPHMLRHSWAHYNLANGMNEHDIANLAGWSSIRMLERYGAALAQERAIAAGRANPVGNMLKVRAS